MYCRKCGKEINDDSEFCQYCGNAVFDKSDSTISENNVETKNKNDIKNINKRNNISKRSVILFSFIIIVLLIGMNIRKSPVEKVVDMSKSVFLLKIYDVNNNIIATGSGFLAFDDLTVVTNYHVIEGAYAIDVISEDNQTFNVKEVLNYDIDKDIVLLKLNISTKFKVLNLDLSPVVKKGDEIVVIGSPLGLKNPISNGIVSSIIQEDDNESIQITAPISSGSSGGPLFNNKGKVVGITYASYEGGQNLNLAIPIKYAIDLKNNNSKNVPIKEFKNSLYGRQPINCEHSHSIVKYFGFIYHNFNDDYQIVKINIETGEKTALNIFGQYINVYDGKIYYINKDNDAIYATNLDGNDRIDITTNILNKDKDDVYLCDLFVSKDGIIFANIKDLINSDLYALNIDYSLRKKVSGFGDLLNVQYIEDGIIVKRDDSLIFHSLNNFEEIESVKIPKESTNSWLYYNDFYVYTNENGDIHKLDLSTGTDSIVYPSETDKTFIQGIYKDNIYFFMRNNRAKNFTDGNIFKISINGDYYKKVYDWLIYDRNFIDDEIYFIPNKNGEPYSKSDLDGNNLTNIK